MATATLRLVATTVDRNKKAELVLNWNRIETEITGTSMNEVINLSKTRKLLHVACNC